MMSPVFKAMLSADFKEKNQQEISLPGKKADQFVDFLRQIYPQFDYPITLENIEHIYVLADEYQTTQLKTSCLNLLQQWEVTNYNLSTMTVLAQKMNCDQVRQKCYKMFNDMTIDELKRSRELKLLDSESLHLTLLAKAEHLEKCLEKIQPQFVGVLDCLLYVWGFLDTKTCRFKSTPKRCPVHMTSKDSKVSGSITERLKCTVCKQAWKDMVSHSKDYDWRWGGRYYSDTGMYFDENIVTALQEMVRVLKT